MDIIRRNFFKLLQSGALDINNQVEPMSPWKWEQLYKLALLHGVGAIIADGIKKHENDFFMTLPEDLTKKWNKTVADIEKANEETNHTLEQLMAIFNKEQLRPILLKGQYMTDCYPKGNHRTPGDVDIYFPFAPQANKANIWADNNGIDIDKSEKGITKYSWQGLSIDHHRQMMTLTNKWLNIKLQHIIDSEIKCCDSTYYRLGDTKIEVLPPTLDLLMMILRSSRYLLNDGISLKQIVDTALFLKQKGHLVDYSKLDKWIATLSLEKMASLQVSMLMQLLGMDEEELPFASPYKQGIGDIFNDLFIITGKYADEWYFSQGKNIFVRATNSGAMMWHVKHSASFFKYYPQEAFTNFFSSFAHSLSHIEE